MRTTPVIPADAVKVGMGQPVLIDEAAEEVVGSGSYRIPKIFRFPGGEICTTFAIGRDTQAGMGLTSPAFVSCDEGYTWERSTWPHPGFHGANPIVAPILDGEHFCFPVAVGGGLEMDLRDLPKPVGKVNLNDALLFRRIRVEPTGR